MTKRVLTVVGFLIVVLVFVEIIGLLQLRASLASYAAYWRERSSQPGEITYVALGDSAAQSIGATRPQKGYVGLLAARLEAQSGQTVRVVNLSVSGAKIRDVIDKQIPQLQNYDPDFVTIEIGANDIVSFEAKKFEADYAELAPLLPKNTVIATMPNFGGRIERTAAVASANQIIIAAAKEPALPVADLYGYTKSRESPLAYAADFFHPNNRGHKNWADAFWAVLQRL